MCAVFFFNNKKKVHLYWLLMRSRRYRRIRETNVGSQVIGELRRDSEGKNI